MRLPGRRAFGSFAVGVCVILLAACSSDSGSATPSTLATTTSTTQPKPLGIDADLTVTGDRTAVIKGEKGDCMIPRFAAPTYDLTGANYPDLGPGGSVSVVGPITVANGGTVPASVRIIIGDVGFLTPPEGTGISLSNNKKVVTINADLTGGPGVTEDINILPPDSSLMVHVTGTIRCTT